MRNSPVKMMTPKAAMKMKSVLRRTIEAKDRDHAREGTRIAHKPVQEGHRPIDDRAHEQLET